MRIINIIMIHSSACWLKMPKQDCRPSEFCARSHVTQNKICQHIACKCCIQYLNEGLCNVISSEVLSLKEESSTVQSLKEEFTQRIAEAERKAQLACKERDIAKKVTH